MLINHGGFFLKSLGRKYVHEKVTFVDYVDVYELSVHEVDTMMKETGYVKIVLIYYHSCILETYVKIVLIYSHF